MKCLSILQPWAWAILYGGKSVENRSWGTYHRGPLLIHAGKSDRLVADAGAWIREQGIATPPRYDFGAILGIVELTHCVDRWSQAGCLIRQRCSPWADNDAAYYWLLANARPFRQPIPYRGRQGLFDVQEPEVLAAIEAQLNSENP